MGRSNPRRPDADTVVERMQAAALDRAIVDRTGIAAHLAFAGALESARPVPSGADPLLLGTLLAVAIESRYGTDLDVDEVPSNASIGSAGRPPLEPDGRRRPVVEGALLAHDRYDLSVETAAALANLTVRDFEAEREAERRR